MAFRSTRFPVPGNSRLVRLDPMQKLWIIGFTVAVLCVRVLFAGVTILRLKRLPKAHWWLLLGLLLGPSWLVWGSGLHMLWKMRRHSWKPARALRFLVGPSRPVVLCIELKQPKRTQEIKSLHEHPPTPFKRGFHVAREVFYPVLCVSVSMKSYHFHKFCHQAVTQHVLLVIEYLIYWLEDWWIRRIIHCTLGLLVNTFVPWLRNYIAPMIDGGID